MHLADGFAYLSLITDVYSHKIVGFYLSKDLSAQGPLKALKMALANNPNSNNLIHHSDRGVQYCCDAYVKLLQDNKIKISMTQNGDPRENAVAERVNGILKTELLEEVFADFETAQHCVAVACSIYNHLRPHGSIANLKPLEAHLKTGNLKKRGKITIKSINKKRRWKWLCERFLEALGAFKVITKKLSIATQLYKRITSSATDLFPVELLLSRAHFRFHR